MLATIASRRSHVVLTSASPSLSPSSFKNVAWHVSITSLVGMSTVSNGFLNKEGVAVNGNGRRVCNEYAALTAVRFARGSNHWWGRPYMVDDQNAGPVHVSLPRTTDEGDNDCADKNTNRSPDWPEKLCERVKSQGSMQYIGGRLILHPAAPRWAGGVSDFDLRRRFHTPYPGSTKP